MHNVCHTLKNNNACKEAEQYKPWWGGKSIYTDPKLTDVRISRLSY